MSHINDIASWFNKNNILRKNEKEDLLRINLLCLYTKVAYNVKGLKLVCDNLTFDDKLNMNMGITDMNLNPNFTEEELYIIKTINREYGYLTIENLLYYLQSIKEELSYENITNHLKEEVTQTLEGYELFEFNETPVVVNDKVFFVDNNTKITDEIIEKFKNYSYEDQYIFTVFSNDKGLVIY